jgi:hypothetical protein
MHLQAGTVLTTRLEFSKELTLWCAFRVALTYTYYTKPTDSFPYLDFRRLQQIPAIDDRLNELSRQR